LIALITSAGDAIYFSVTDELFKKIPSLLAVAIIVFINFIILLIYPPLLFDDYTIGFDP
jgi:hypothetical protein